MSIKYYLNDFLNLFFPKVCHICSNNLLYNENIICTKCFYHLPRIDMSSAAENQVAQVFWGRINIQKAFSFIHYYKGGNFQKLMHQFKYKGYKEIGFELGKRFSKEISKQLTDIDLIIPVPLFWKKLKKRGYNQAEWIAKGIAETINKPVFSKTLVRIKENPTQTNKSRYQRWENVEGIFSLKNSKSIKNKHILLVDDVLTTGSTLEACALTLQKEENTKISIFTLGFA